MPTFTLDSAKRCLTSSRLRSFLTRSHSWPASSKRRSLVTRFFGSFEGLFRCPGPLGLPIGSGYSGRHVEVAPGLPLLLVRKVSAVVYYPAKSLVRFFF